MSRRPPHHGVYARIGRSRIHGVGVRAIRDIPPGVDVFQGDSDEVVWVRRDRVRRLPAELRRLYTDFAMFWGKRLGVPTPVNEAVVREVKRHGVGTLTPDPKNLEPIAALVPA